MTDYWVSSKKHYCDVCKCWISGTTLNIKNHESSARHISSLRKKLIDSHRKQVEKQQQDEFEKAELARLNSVTVDGPAPMSPLDDQGLTSSSVFTYSRMLKPPVDKEKEQAIILQRITSALSGVPMEDSSDKVQTTWMAFIDKDDGTLTYYNNITGLKTKTRPRDFDGVLPIASSSLTSNWTLKFDPSKGAKYYHNTNTGEIRWLEQPAQPPPEHKTRETRTDVTQPVVRVETIAPPQPVKPTSQIKIKLESNEPTQPSQTSTTTVKPEPQDPPPAADPYDTSGLYAPEKKPLPKEQYEATIGQWEVVKPAESVYSHSIVSLEPYVNPPKEKPKEPDIFDVIREATYETPLLNVDDMQLQEKRTFDHKEKEKPDNPVHFARRKIPKRNA
ncbi:WW domain-binding protein 4 like protein [Babesia gibsoni]|uniref:WW domain-binding protein 4 like protein n=1 Tax=Babesia gibsoni TaxID=33632 RepID=A0AAD8PGP2_BABGI|nr:WW domain-binding protein 4 like protein [Babesia gibsoni]